MAILIGFMIGVACVLHLSGVNPYAGVCSNGRRQSIDFFKEDDSGRKFALLSTIIVVGLAFHGYMFFVVKENDIQNKYSIPSFSINFEETVVQDSDSLLIGNGETEVYSFSRD